MYSMWLMLLLSYLDYFYLKSYEWNFNEDELVKIFKDIILKLSPIFDLFFFSIFKMA